MSLKDVAEVCVVGILISQLGLVFKPYSSLASNVGEQIFTETCEQSLHNESLINENHDLDNEMQNKDKLEDAINISSIKYGVDKRLIRSLIKQESNFNPCCVSPAGAIGLMQIMPNTIKKFNVEDPYDIYQNIDAGTKHLKGMIDRYEGDIVKAIAAYNCGGNALDKSGFQSLEDTSMLPEETKIHVTKVFYYYKNGF